MLMPLASRYWWFHSNPFTASPLPRRPPKKSAGSQRSCPLAAESRRLVLQVLEDTRGAHATTDAHGDHAVLRGPPLHLAHELDGELAARGAHRVSEGYRATVHVGLLQVQADLPDHGQGLRRERLVELDKVHIVEA